MAIEPTPPAPPKNQNRARRAGHGFSDIEPVEHRLPGGDRGQRQSGSGGEIERARLTADDPFVNEMEFHIRALPADAARVEHFIARLEESRLVADFRDNSGGVVADHLDCARVGRRAPGPLPLATL